MSKILETETTAPDHIQGNMNAPITLVEYGDFQCPHTGKAYFVVKQLQEHFGDQMKFVFRNFPSAEMHPYAEPAAETTEFANEQGQFWEMHDLIYENQEALSLPMLFELAEALGLSRAQLNSVIENQAYAEKIQNDFLDGVHNGVNETPTFFINDKKYNGPIEFEILVEAFNSSLTTCNY